MFARSLGRKTLAIAAAWAFGLAAGWAQQLPIPQLKSVFPCGAQKGTTALVEIAGGNLEEPTKLYFNHPGITAVFKPDPKRPTPAKFEVTVAPDVPVGDYDVRSISKYGISNPRCFSVGDIAEMQESEPNDSREKANRVSMNTVVNGRISPAEDVDWFVFSAKKGQRVLIECRAWRVDSRLDGTMTLYDAQGKQLVASQDENIRDQKRDPFIDFDVPADGDYYLRFTDRRHWNHREIRWLAVGHSRHGLAGRVRAELLPQGLWSFHA